ncbi:MAG: helix-turn-helix domain-containing protein [Myxococcota bacterium]
MAEPGDEDGALERVPDVDLTSLPPDVRLHAWPAYIQRLVNGLRISPMNDAGRFGGKVRVDDAGRFRLFEPEGGPQLVLRRPPQHRDVFNEFILLVQLDGTCAIERGPTHAIAAPGQLAVIGANHALDLHYENDFRQLVVQLPRELVLRRYDWLGDIDGTVIGPENPAGQLLAQTIIGLGRVIRDLDPEQRLHAFNSVLAQLGALKAPRHEVAKDQIWERARAYIMTSLSDPELTPDQVATAIGVKRRTLDAAFARRAESVGRFIWGQRLERAAAILAGATGSSLTRVAFSCGFNSASHFSRAFRRRFGVPPGEYAARSGRE